MYDGDFVTTNTFAPLDVDKQLGNWANAINGEVISCRCHLIGHMTLNLVYKVQKLRMHLQVILRRLYKNMSHK